MSIDTTTVQNLDDSTLDHIQQKVTELYDSNDNWNNILISTKEKSGVPTDEISITLGVEQKMPLNDIPNKDIFPNEFIIDGKKVLADVVVMPELSAGRCNTLPTPGSDPNTWVMPASGSRTTHRPLKGGLSVGTMPAGGWGGSYVNGGTLGGFAVDLDDYTLVGVSNNHVLGGYLFAGSLSGGYTNSQDKTWWTFLSCGEVSDSPNTITRYPVIQRSSHDTYDSSYFVNEPNFVGNVKNAFPFQSLGNKVDCSTFALDTTRNNLSSTTVNWQQYGLDYNQAMDWATDSEINSLLTTELGAPVFKAGRTEGPVGWPGSAPYGQTCKLSAYAFGTATISFGGNLGSVQFLDNIWFRSNDTNNLPASSGGDSGSFWCALFNSTNPELSAWKVIGLHFAGNGISGIGNRITNVSRMMRLSAYKGDEIDIGYKGYDMQVIEGRQSALSAMIGGKVYWQAGSTGFPATTSFDP